MPRGIPFLNYLAWPGGLKYGIIGLCLVPAMIVLTIILAAVVFVLVTKMSTP